MSHLIALMFLSSLAAAASAFPHKTFREHILKGSAVESESSGSGPDDPVQGIIKVVHLNPQALTQSALFRKGLTSRRAPSLASRFSFPAFLSQGRPGPAFKAPLNPLHHLHHLQAKKTVGMELKKKQGLQMWLRAIDKGDKMAVSLPVNLKDAKQTCSAVPFTQRVTADGCDTVTVHNKLCFGQCSSLFVPSGGEFSGPGAAATGPHRWAPCSRCAPSKAHTVVIPLRCGVEVREKQVMVVEECKCETGREERNAETAASPHL